ncbi:hypothetical protein IQ250_04525 [Pseudanabaenaceae cyanobacterium LEGE 13415]|nr:hypothetical protein [Pseudanabaenaceae cyanobacterium LEGE 13415]
MSGIDRRSKVSSLRSIDYRVFVRFANRPIDCDLPQTQGNEVTTFLMLVSIQAIGWFVVYQNDRVLDFSLR